MNQYEKKIKLNQYENLHLGRKSC